jgi:murein DD-endopeptidase MepM/ murein hydrolase activator NlpD
MKIIIVNKDHAQARSFTLGGWTRAFLSVCLLGIPTFVGAWGYSWLVSADRGEFFTADSKVWTEILSARESDIEEERRTSEAKIEALSAKMAELQARLMRLDALGEKLTSAANLDQGEFDFNQVPAYGGPSEAVPNESYTKPDFFAALDQFSNELDSREQQLTTIDALLSNRDLKQQAFVAGAPVPNAWITSPFGYRTDPFTGKKAFHSGIDFTARAGSKVSSVAAGVVNWSGRHPEYGNMVEIKHASGLVTRYAHNSTNLVKAGDVVKKGQIIALSGSTGRSTAPHVHFEVYQNGRVVDPSSYIRRTIR